MKKIVIAGLALSSLVATGCSSVSGKVYESGRGASKLVFPPIKDAWQKEGIFPNKENVRNIVKNVKKDDVRHLIGPPHFSEGMFAREWDYIFKFNNPQTKRMVVCQYKVLFDKKKRAQSFYWKPANCNRLIAEPQRVVNVIQKSVPVQINQQFMVGSDALFKFNKYKLEDMLLLGQERLNQVASKLLALKNQPGIKAVITGHTDLMGDDKYNLTLSQLRAQTVRAYLVSRGVPGKIMTTQGAGEFQPIKICRGFTIREDYLQCLQPNRRVTFDISYLDYSGKKVDFKNGNSFQIK